MNGIVRWFDDRKGYGFIEPADGGSDVFVHYSGIAKQGGGRRTLTEGDDVSFEIGEAKGKPCALNVTVL